MLLTLRRALVGLLSRGRAQSWHGSVVAQPVVARLSRGTAQSWQSRQPAGNCYAVLAVMPPRARLISAPRPVTPTGPEASGKSCDAYWNRCGRCGFRAAPGL